MKWTIADHVCRQCLGRVLLTTDDQGQSTARCSDCGQQATGGPEAICACGADTGATRIRLRCVANPAVTRAAPFEIVVEEVTA